MKRFGLARWERIRKRQEFLDVTQNGQKYYTPHFIVFLKPNPQGLLRLGVTVSRRVGKAVKRNRVKRLLREFFRLHKYQLPKGHDIVIIAKPKAATLTYHDVVKELGKLLCKSR